MNNFPFVSIIIPNWNGGKVFKNCIKSLSKINYPHWELIVIDNGSIDGSEQVIDLIKLPSYKKKLLINKQNLGYSKANNQGFKVSLGKYILILNNDTTVKKDFLGKLVSRIESDRIIGVIQPKIMVMDKPTLLDNSGSFLTKLGLLQHWGYMERDKEEFNKERTIFSAKGACMLIRREVIEKVGLFDEDFGSYFEESDFCWRVWLAGFKILYYPNAVVCHKVGFTSKKQDQIMVNYHSIKNRLASIIINLSIANLLIIGGLHLLLLNGLAIYYLLRFRIAKSFMIYQALVWNIKSLPQTLQKRNFVQKARIKQDSEIFKFIMQKIDWKKMLIHFGRVEANFK